MVVTTAILVIDLIQTIVLIGIIAFAISGHETHKRHEREMAAREQVIRSQRKELDQLTGMYRTIMGVEAGEIDVHHSGQIELEHKKEEA